MEMINRFVLSMVDTVRCRYRMFVAKNKKPTRKEKSKLQSCWSLLAWSEDMGSASGFRGYQPVLIWHEVCFYKLVDFIHAVSVRV
jgi:hypothetical protein